MPEKNGGPYERSTGYRKDYLKKHKGFFGIYTCAYCGRLITKKNMQVDHIYPIGQVKTTMKGKAFVIANTFWKGSKESDKGINGTWNTVSACPACNHKKSDKGGLWIWRGYIGRIVYPVLNAILYIDILYGILEVLFKNSMSHLLGGIICLAVLRAIGQLILKKSK
jgi:high-affinity Fe2+/Pb2+ permease